MPTVQTDRLRGSPTRTISVAMCHAPCSLSPAKSGHVQPTAAVNSRCHGPWNSIVLWGSNCSGSCWVKGCAAAHGEDEIGVSTGILDRRFRWGALSDDLVRPERLSECEARWAIGRGRAGSSSMPRCCCLGAQGCPGVGACRESLAACGARIS